MFNLYDQMQVIVLMNSMLIVLIPLFFDNLVYIRLVANIVFINLILIANAFQHNRLKMLLNLFAYSFFWGFFLYLTRFDFIVVPFFKYNFLFT